MRTYYTSLTVCWAALGLAGALPADPPGDGKVHPKTHVLWATQGYWHYGDARSGDGEKGAVRLSAVAGDTIEFRQSHGRHRVFFYRTAPEESELGERVVVDRDFEVIGDGPALDRLPARIFRRTNLATPLPKEGRSPLIKIKLRPTFDQPLYFGSIEEVAGGGTKPFFGVIYPVTRRHVHERKPPPVNFRFSPNSRTVRPNREAWDKGILGRLAASQPPVEFAVRDGKFLALTPGRVKDEGKDLTPQWFRTLPEAGPASRPWYFAQALDLAPDYPGSVVVAVGPKKDGVGQWVALLSNAGEDGKRVVSALPEDGSAMRFVRAVPVADGPGTAEAGRQVFAAGADINNDTRTDLVLVDAGGILRIALNESIPRNSLTDPPALRFPAGTIDLDERFRRKNIYLVLPFDADFDGWTDLLILSRKQDAVILFNDAPGRISGREGVVLPETAFPIAVSGVEDLDGDGRADVILKGEDGKTIRAFFNDGDRRFTP